MSFLMRGQTYSILELASILKEKQPQNLTFSRTQATPKYQDLSLALISELLPSYILVTVNQRLVWLFQLYLQTLCDCISSSFRTPTGQLTLDIQLDACQTGPLSFTPIPYKTLSRWGFQAITSETAPWWSFGVQQHKKGHLLMRWLISLWGSLVAKE